jgi:primosomal protein N''
MGRETEQAIREIYRRMAEETDYETLQLLKQQLRQLFLERESESEEESLRRYPRR